MQALDLNLASRPFKNNTLLWVGFSVLAVALGAITVSNVATRQRHARMLADLESKVGGIEARVADLRTRALAARRDIERFDVAALSVRTAKANEVIRWKAFSWTGLFNELEKVQPWAVQMSAVHPTFRPENPSSTAGQIQAGLGIPVVVDGVAKTLKDFLEFERELIKSRAFTRVEPDRTDIDEQTRETVFTLRFLYDPEAAVGPPPAPEVEVAGAADEPDPSGADEAGPAAADDPGSAAVVEAAAPAAVEPAPSGPVAADAERPRADPPRVRRDGKRRGPPATNASRPEPDPDGSAPAPEEGG
jgi:hypothetical protein